ncbi:MAG: IS3 family transposase [Bacteroidetes bacterium]|nr:IS3 family transposase [Bacteroidota bacterium]
MHHDTPFACGGEFHSLKVEAIYQYHLKDKYEAKRTFEYIEAWYNKNRNPLIWEGWKKFEKLNQLKYVA